MEKRGLGRGLSALIPDASEVEFKEIRDIPLKMITPNPYQPRTLFDPIKLEELVNSIREHGILQPIVLNKIATSNYQIVAGERRFRAAQVLEMERIPSMIVQVSPQEQLEMAIVENLQREDIGALESARAYQRLMQEFGMTQESIATRVGKSRSAISNTLRLLNLPEPIQESLERNEITEGHARALMTLTGESNIVKVWERVVRQQLSVRDTERLARDWKQSLYTGESKEEPSALTEVRFLKDPNTAAVTEQLQQALGTKVTLRRFAGGAGRLEIEFFSEEDLERVVDALLNR